MSKVAGVVDWGIQIVQRTDLFGERHEDAIVQFGRKHRGEYLSETNRHWLAWLYATRERDGWPQHLLDLVRYWGDQKSCGKAEDFDSLVDELRAAGTVRA